MKKICVLIISAFLTCNLMAAGSDSSGGSSDSGDSVSKPSLKQAVSFVKRAGKLEKNNKPDKAIKLYSQAFKKL
jgi:hypothetical protein